MDTESRFPRILNGLTREQPPLTMSIFLTQQVSYATKVEAFNARGLSNQVSVKASDSSVYAISRAPLESRIRYENLNVELPGRIVGKPIAYTEKPGYTAILPKFDRFHFEAPTLIVEMKTGGEALHAFGMFETGTSKMGLYAGKPNSEQMRQIMTMGVDPYESVPAGNVNSSGYIAYIQAWRGINAFFYMGGGDVSKVEPLKAGIRRDSVEELNTILEEDESLTGTFFNLSGVAFSSGTTKHLSPGEIRLIRDPENWKASPGFVFPYFQEMLTADPETPFRHFLNLYHHCLAATPEETAGSIEILRRGFRFLSSTSAGRVIQHIYFGIQLCIEMGGRMLLASDGSEYAGFVIEGEGLELLQKNRVRASFPTDDIETALESLSTHTSAVKAIYNAVVEVARMDGAEEKITIEECRVKPRALRSLIQARKAIDINDLRSILDEHVGSLRYRQVYWEITAKNIVRFLQCMVQRVDIYEEPMYLHIDVLTNRSSNILEYLSVFGAQAPSFFYGNTIKQIANTGVEDPNLKLVNNKRAVPHIPFTKKGLVAAAGDWATVRRTHSFKFAGPKKIGPNTGFSETKQRDGVITQPEFDEFYPLLRIWSFSGNNEVPVAGSSKGKKRQNDEDQDMEEGSSKKAKVSYSFV